MRLSSPKATALSSSTGKMVITGLRDAAEAKLVAKDVIRKIKEAGIDIKDEPVVTVQNIDGTMRRTVFRPVL